MATVHRFTPENARHFAALGNAAIAAEKQRLRDAVETACASSVEDYTARRLVRVRLQLDAIDAAIVKEQAGGSSDSKRLKELIEAQGRLNLQERELSMRPAPGTTKPQAARKPRSGAPVPLPEPDDASGAD